MLSTSIHWVQPKPVKVRAAHDIDVLNLAYEVRSGEHVRFALFFENNTVEEAIEELINALIDAKMELHREKYEAAQGVLFGGDK